MRNVDSLLSGWLHPGFTRWPTPSSFIDDLVPAEPPWRGPTLPKSETGGFLDLSKYRGSWLEYAKGEPQWLRETDLLSSEWVGKLGRCWNVMHPTDPERIPWWHPNFVFTVPVHLIRIRLTRMKSPTQPGEKLWDIIFSGPPGNDHTVTNNATPVGCKLCQLPEFCPPLRDDALYELRVTEMEEPSRFDERILLRPRTDEAFRDATELVVRRPPRTARPALKVKHQNGPLDALHKVRYDPETGEPEDPGVDFL